MKCYFCKRTISNNAFAKFSCEHRICSFCLIGDIIKQQINKITCDTNTIETKCKCNNGTFEFPFISLKEMNQSIYSNEELQCPVHNEKKMSYHCKSCKSMFCQDCASEHQKHEIVVIEEYVEEVKKMLVNIKYKNYMSFSTNIEKFYTNFLDHVNIIYNNDIKGLDNLISLIENLKEKIKIEKDKLIQREDLLFKIIRNYYSQAYETLSQLHTSSSNSNYYLAKQISKIKFDIDDFNIEKLDTIHPEIEKLNNEIQNVIATKHLNAKIVYPYFGIVKQFVKSIENTNHSQSIKSVIYLSDVNQIATGSNDKTIKIFSIPNYTLVSTITSHDQPINSITFCSPYLISTDKKGMILIHDALSSFNLVQTIDDEIEEINHLSNLKFVNGFISSSEDTTAKVWKRENDSFVLYQLLNGHESGVTCSIEMDSGDIITGSNDMSVNVWKNADENGYECIQAIGGFNSGVTSLCKYKTFLIVALNDGTISVLENKGESRQFEEMCILSQHRKMINMVMPLKDDRFASCAFDKTIIIWSYNQMTKEFKADQEMKEHQLAVFGLAETKDGKLISVSADKKMIVWKRVKNN